MIPARGLVAALFVTGFAALAQEVIWCRMLRRLLGATASAQAAVLAGFLGGMAVGAWLGGLALRRGWSGPATLWGLTGIAAAAASFVLWLVIWFLEGLDRVPPGVGPLVLFCVAVAAAPLGAQFPATVEALPRDGAARWIAWAYGLNALGGAIGALLAPLLLLPWLGERTSLLVAGSAQVLSGLTVLRLARGERSIFLRAETPGLRARDLALVFSCAVVVTYWEILLARVLGLVVGSSVHAFAFVTGGVVFGVGVASVLLALSGARRSVVSAAAPWISLCALALFYFLAPHLPSAYLVSARAMGPSPWWGPLGAGLLAFLACAPLGAVFPGVVGRDPGGAARAAAASGAGSALGAWIGGICGGVIGLDRGWMLGLGLAAVTAALSVERRRPSLAAAAGLGLCTICLVEAAPSLADRWDLKPLLAGVYTWGPEDILSRDPGAMDHELLVVEQGAEAVISIERVGETVFVKANGKVEGSVPAHPDRVGLADLPTQILLGALAGILKPDGATAVIGLGSGMTLGAAWRSGVGTLDLLEIEPACERALLAPMTARYFIPYLAGTLRAATRVAGVPAEPRVRRWFGDARSLLSGTLADHRWDAIASQPSEPWLSSSAPLFTREFFARAARRLQPGGVFIQWVQLYQLDFETLELVVRTFQRVFERVYVLRPPGTGELILLGLREPLDFARLLDGVVRVERAAPGLLRSTGIEAPVDLVATVLLGPDGVEAWVAAGEDLNVDDRNSTELHAAPRVRDSRDIARANLLALQKRGAHDPVTKYLPATLRDPTWVRGLAARNLRMGDFWEAIAILAADESSEAGLLREEAKREILSLDAVGPAKALEERP